MGHFAVRALWTIFRSTKVVHFYSGEWCNIVPALTVRIAIASACPDAVLFRHLAGSIRPGVP